MNESFCCIRINEMGKNVEHASVLQQTMKNHWSGRVEFLSDNNQLRLLFLSNEYLQSFALYR